MSTPVRSTPWPRWLTSAGAQLVALRVTEHRLDTLNEAITIEVQRGAADAYFSNATLNGRFALRACLVNYRTTDADLVRLLDTVRDVAGSLTQ